MPRLFDIGSFLLVSSFFFQDFMILIFLENKTKEMDWFENMDKRESETYIVPSLVDGLSTQKYKLINFFNF